MAITIKFIVLLHTYIRTYVCVVTVLIQYLNSQSICKSCEQSETETATKFGTFPADTLKLNYSYFCK